ncbi:MAG: hypothetical protein CM1200mP10_20120 [Candidatus Neomarinimicrobiota bacterium]|nr:MAG: hypothetical protein CM1200mP10_20120 [Candidatus Neomarinimicrobiota bacterium]
MGDDPQIDEQENGLHLNESSRPWPSRKLGIHTTYLPFGDAGMDNAYMTGSRIFIFGWAISIFSLNVRSPWKIRQQSYGQTNQDFLLYFVFGKGLSLPGSVRVPFVL